MSNPLKRRFDPTRELDDEISSVTARTTSSVVLHRHYEQETWQDCGELLDTPRQSQYLGPSYANPSSDLPIPQQAGSLLNIFSNSFLSPNVDDQITLTNLDGMDYSIDNVLPELGSDMAEIVSEHSQLLSASSHVASNSSSLIPEPSQSRLEDVIPVDEHEIICYGMLHNVDIKLVGDMHAIRYKLDKSETAYERFEMTEREEHVVMCFRDDGEMFGYVRSGVGKALAPLMVKRDVEFEPIVPTIHLMDIITRANKASDATVKIDINIYGPRQTAIEVGDILSSRKLWLQRSAHMRRGIAYDNPHFLRLRINGIEVQPVRHQQEALGFMLERESGHINDRYRLWETVVLEDGSENYRHRITGDEIKNGIRPNERGGGILADEMGMGKSLSILALIMKTLDDGKGWAHQQDDSTTVDGAIKRSRSTLIVVQSALLIYNWMNEINKHLKGGVNVIKYHGSDRPKDTCTVSDSDIVVTTYNTLTAEFQIKSRPSVLNCIDWYRVVLDEAHIIRRRSTAFYRACDDLHANSRWCLTGTPIQNKLADIGTLFSFIRAEPFSKASVFRNLIESPFEQGEEDSVKDRLVKLIEALCLRRTKDIIQLPQLRHRERILEFSAAEREQYENTEKILTRMIRHRVGEIEESSKFGLFQVQLQMRLLCNHGTFQQPFSWRRRASYRSRCETAIPALGQNSHITCSGCDVPMPIIVSSRRNGSYDQCAHVLCSECFEQSSMLGGGGQIHQCPLCARRPRAAMIEDGAMTDGENTHDCPATENAGGYDVDYFSNGGHSTKMQTLVEDIKEDLSETKRYLDKAKIPYLRIDGSCSLSQRQVKLDQFANDDEIPVLIMTTGTGGFGLNLTCANRVFIVELQWNPGVESQAIARAIRLGQKSEVLVTRYLIKDTVEKHMSSQQQWKKQLVALGFDDMADLMDGGNISR
ncbi:snf2 family domain-containing [Trichoderma arundinaceum]|uniref:Snf2 family domain-containing n=1 Tax=Trichoderma arundinaceum TaxID=490622 RepID=A0A395NRF1_TRIAR|nr:snf2 family domain-containing [Trichoderma arundinaceum]